GRHAERLVAGLIDAARRAVPRAVKRVGHLFTVAQRLAEALALARHQPIARIESQLGDEALAERPARQANLARHLSERGRRVAIGRVEQGAGPGDWFAETKVCLPV